MIYLVLNLLLSSLAWAGSPELSYLKVDSKARYFSIQTSETAIKDLERFTNDDFNTFTKSIDSIIARGQTLVGKKLPQNLEIVFLNPTEIRKISRASPIKILALTLEGISNRIFVSTEIGFNKSSPYFIAHELFHLLDHTSSMRWAREGMADLFAHRLTGQTPALAVLDFRNSSRLQLTIESFTNFSLANYGFAFAVVFDLWKNDHQDQIFTNYLQQGALNALSYDLSRVLQNNIKSEPRRAKVQTKGDVGPQSFLILDVQSVARNKSDLKLQTSGPLEIFISESGPPFSWIPIQKMNGAFSLRNQFLMLINTSDEWVTFDLPPIKSIDPKISKPGIPGFLRRL